MLLSSAGIRRHMAAGNIIIEPFKEENLKTVSYDVSLGEWYYRELNPEGGITIYNPFDETDVRRIWGGPYRAVPAKEHAESIGISVPEAIAPDDLVIWIAPGETILCHTEEFIGGRDCVTTLMKGRSSLGRNFIEVCKCAGWGDVGYINRWTMEVTNNSRYYHIPLVVGRRIAQLAFFEVEPVGEDYVSQAGKYQATGDVEELKRDWRPETMLPKMFEDREARLALERVQTMGGRR